jgi:hypothetical protein
MTTFKLRDQQSTKTGTSVLPTEKERLAATETGSSKFVTKAQLAEMYQVSTRTIDDWMATGRIPFYKINSLVRFDPQEVANSFREKYRVARRSRP